MVEPYEYRDGDLRLIGHIARPQGDPGGIVTRQPGKVC